MASSYREIASRLLDKPSLQFPAKGAVTVPPVLGTGDGDILGTGDGGMLGVGAYAVPLDRLYSEQVVINNDTHTRFPTPTKARVPGRCIIGTYHPSCAYLKLVDAYKTGGDDKHDNWTLLYRLDLQKWAADAEDTDYAITWPDVLAKDGYSKADEYGDDSSVVTWQFDVINPDDYTPAAKNTAHPLVAAAKLVAESIQRSGPTATVNRRYEKLATLYDYEWDEETRSWLTVTREILARTMATSPDAPSQRTEVSYRALGTAFAMRTNRTIGAAILTGTRTTSYRYIDYTFPRLHLGVYAFLTGEDAFFWNDFRAPFSKKIRVKIEVSYHTSSPTPATLWQIIPKEAEFSGGILNYALPTCLTDGDTITKTKLGVTEEFTFGASSPTRSQYEAAIGTWKLINEEIVEWRFGLYRRTQYSIQPE